MRCSNCGTKNKKKTNYCKKCGSELKKKNTKKIVIILSVILLCVGVGIICLYVFFSTGISESDFNTYIESENKLMDIEYEYLNEDGFVESDNMDQLLDEIEKELNVQKTNGIISLYNRESDNIYIEYEGGIKYMFIPRQEGILGIGEENNIITLEPVQNEYGVGISKFEAWIDKYYNNFEYKGSYDVAASAKLIADKYPERYKYCENILPDKLDFFDDALSVSGFANESVSIERLKHLDNYKVIIFEGHGFHNEMINSILFTGEKFIGYKDFSPYKNDMKNKEIVISSFPSIKDVPIIGEIPYSIERTYAVTSKFFEKNIDKLDNTLVYLGSCSSGKDRVLADVFLSKGASAVVGFDETVGIEYEMIARSLFFYNMTHYEMSVVDALDKTLDRIGCDSGPYYAAMVYFDKDYSASKFTFSGEESKNAKEETDEDNASTEKSDEESSQSETESQNGNNSNNENSAQSEEKSQEEDISQNEENSQGDNDSEKNSSSEQEKKFYNNINNELSEYMFTDFFTFVNSFGDMEDAHATSAVEYKNDYLIVSSSEVEDKIDFIEINNPCDYSLNGIKYGMTLYETRMNMQVKGYELEDSTDYFYRYKNDFEYFVVYSDDGITVSSVSEILYNYCN